MDFLKKNKTYKMKLNQKYSNKTVQKLIDNFKGKRRMIFYSINWKSDINSGKKYEKELKELIKLYLNEVNKNKKFSKETKDGFELAIIDNHPEEYSNIKGKSIKKFYNRLISQLKD